MSISNAEILETLEVPKEEKTKENKTLNIFQRFVKRIFDILIGLIGIIVLIPVTIVVYIIRIILRENDGPIFYEQLRIGKNGKAFRLYKYRTMIVGAEEKLQEYLNENPEAKKEYKENKKLRNDPRITKVGKFLRKASLDEIPQFINILKGEMSLIGPRPYLLAEKEDMEDYYNDIIKVKPGITGLWQVSGAGYSTFKQRLKLEKQYVDNCSIKEDIKIFFKTFKAMIHGHGAGI